MARGETIVAAALRSGPGCFSAPPPARHGDLFASFGRAAPEDQGFLTSTGRFVDRAEAKRIAMASGQPLTEHGEFHRDKAHLFSEDLW